MSKSTRVRPRDLRAVYRIAGDCRDLGDDSAAWRRVWFEQLARLVGADLGVGGEQGGWRAGEPADLGTADWGWDGGFDRAGWERSCAEFRDDPRLTRTTSMKRYIPRGLVDDGAALARTDLISDRGWYRCWNYQNIQRPMGVDHTVWCFRALSRGPGDEYSGVILARAPGRPDFTAREKAVVRESHALIAPLVGGPLARFADPSPATLPPRTRQVLRRVLEGDSDKQVAARLGITPLTVNQHTKLIFRHFGVQSRAELLARWVRRGWGGRFAWADPG